jgi:RNA polymerase sigma factor (sigma-70 family)
VSDKAGCDEIAVRSRGIARHVASQFARKFPGVDRDDLESECWLNVLRGARSYDPSRGALDAWLYIHARHGLFSFCRRELYHGMVDLPRRERFEARFTPMTEAAGESIPARPPTDDPDWADLLARLRPRERQLIDRVYRYGAQYAELVERFGGTTNTVKKALSRARENLAPEIRRDEV